MTVRLILAVLLAGLMPASPHPQPIAPCALVAEPRPFFTQTGRASWYGRRHDGHTTADGSLFDRSEFTAAHRSLKFGTVVQVTNLGNHRMVKVRITDRGPRAGGRIIDVSAAAARELGMQHRGTARVRIEAFAYDQFPD
jgi:rare lipoprotein A